MDKSIQQDIAIIERYLAKSLNEEELASFHARRKVDPEFQTLLQDMQIMLMGISSVGRKLEKQRLQELEKSLPPVIIRQSLLDKWRSAIASWKNFGLLKKPQLAISALILLLVIGYFLRDTLLPKQAFHAQVYQDYFEPFPNYVYPIEAGPAEEMQDSIKSAFHAYERKNYEEAILIFEHLPAAKQDSVVLFYTACAYLNQGMTDQAIRNYQAYLEDYTDMETEAKWYLAMAYLKKKEISQAHHYLKILANKKGDGLYLRKSRAILETFDH